MKGAGSVLIPATAAFCTLIGTPGRADEGGVGFWLPGSFGSLAAVPGTPGWSLGTIYLHSTVSGSGDVAASRTLSFRGRPVPLTVNLDAQLKARSDLGVLAPGYTLETPILGGQLTLSALAIYGRAQGQIDANIVGALGPIGFATERSISDARNAFGDIFPQAALKWNNGVHNYMVYGMTSFLVGAYNPDRLANLGLGRTGFDGGFGYTYFNPHSGWEASAVVGLTFNRINKHTDYRNGTDSHLDVAVSKFITQQIHVGLVGYAYQQLGADSGSGATLGPFRSRVFGVGPQIGFIIPMGHLQGYLNLKGYKEFEAEHRAEGWNAWVTFAISPAPPTPTSHSRLVGK
jgi:hypothetical protein